jgi:hypothetical protein
MSALYVDGIFNTYKKRSGIMVEFKGSFIQGSENTGFYHSANSSGISIE